MQCDLLRAGLVPGVSKCIWKPKTLIDWNGLRFDFHSKTLSIMQHRIEKTVVSIDELLEKWPVLTFRDIARCVGRIVSMKPVFLGTVQIKARMLHTILNIRCFNNKGWDDRIQVSYPPLLLEAKKELVFWKTFLISNNSRNFIPHPPTWTAWSDASDMAVGGFVAKLFAGQENGQILTADNWLLDAHGVFTGLRHCAQLQVDVLPWSGKKDLLVRDGSDLHPLAVKKVLICHRNLDFAERALDSNERELIAATHVILSCLPHIKNSSITLHMDNINAVSIIAKGSPKPRLQAYSRLIFDLCNDNNVTLLPVWIPRDLNQIADFLSKEVDYEDYQVTELFFQQVCAHMGRTPDVDFVF
jgi:hypothetical protein